MRSRFVPLSAGCRVSHSRAIRSIYLPRHAHPPPHRLHRPRRLRRGHPAFALLRAALRRLAVHGDAADGGLFAGAVRRCAGAGAHFRPGRTPAGAAGEPRRFGRLLCLARACRGAVDAVRGAAPGRGRRWQHRGGAGLYRRRDAAGETRQGHGHDRRGLRPRLHRGTRLGRHARRRQPRHRRSRAPGLSGRVPLRARLRAGGGAAQGKPGAGREGRGPARAAGARPRGAVATGAGHAHRDCSSSR